MELLGKTPCAEGDAAEHPSESPGRGSGVSSQLLAGFLQKAEQKKKKHQDMKTKTKPRHCLGADKSQTVLSYLLVCTLSWEAIDGVRKMLFP